MTEWKLFDKTPPEPTELLENRGWMNLRGQPGFIPRARMVADLVRLCTSVGPAQSVSELGCGDGSLLAILPTHLRCWGYEIGSADVAYAKRAGLDVRKADIVRSADTLEYGDIIVVSEVLEHLSDPVSFLEGLPSEGRILIASSPSRETDEWHNAIHAWAWDPDGYHDLLERSGWSVHYQTECDGGLNSFDGVIGEQLFQAIVGVR